MKLLDVMKKYDRCVMRESAKLTKIYNLLLKESAEADDIEEAEVCPDCGNDPCTCECGESEDVETDEAEEPMSAEEFFGEAEKAAKEDCDETEDVEENDMLRNRPHNAHIDDPAGIKESEECNECGDAKATDEAEEMMSAEEFFGETEADAKETDEAEETDKAKDSKATNEAEEMMSAEEFFSEGDAKKTDESEETEATDEAEETEDTDEAEETKATNEAEEMMSAEEFFSEGDDDKTTDEAEADDAKATDESDDKCEDCDENDEDKAEKKLEESLKSYRRANHHLFNG